MPSPVLAKASERNSAEGSTSAELRTVRPESPLARFPQLTILSSIHQVARSSSLVTLLAIQVRFHA